MRTAFSLVLFVLSTSTASAQSLEGEWRCVGLAIDGKKEKLSAAAKLRLNVGKDTWKETANDQEMQSFKFKVLGVGLIRFDTDGVTLQGRYEIRDGVLRICYGAEPTERIEAAPKTVLSTWRRVD